MNPLPNSNQISSNPIHLHHLPKGFLLSLCRPPDAFIQLPIRSSRSLRPATTSLGSFRQSLPPHRRVPATAKSQEVHQTSAFLNSNRHQPPGQLRRKKSLASVLGIAPNLPALLFRPPELRPSESRPSRPRKFAVAIPMVFRHLVREKSHAIVLQ